MVNLNLLWWIWNHRSEFEFAFVRIWICCDEFEIATVNLNLQLRIWICHGEFKIYCDPQVSRQNFLVHSKTLNSLHNTLFFGAKFFIVWATHFNHYKTFFLAAKLSFSRQNFLSRGKTSSPRQDFLSRSKLLKARQIFLSGGKTFLPLQNFSCNLCTTSEGTS